MHRKDRARLFIARAARRDSIAEAAAHAAARPFHSFIFFLWKPNWQLSFPDASALMVSAYPFRFILWAHSILSPSFNLIFWYYTVQFIHSQRTHKFTPLWTHIHKLYPYEHLKTLSRQILEINEVTTGASLSTGTSPTTKCTTPLHHRIFAHMGN